MNKSFEEQVGMISSRTVDHSGFEQADWVAVAEAWLYSPHGYEYQFITEDLARLAATQLDDGELKTRITEHFRQHDEAQAMHDKAMQAAADAAVKTYDEKLALARTVKPLVLGQPATIGEHTGTLMKWESQFDAKRDPELLSGYYLEGKPNGLSCAPCGIPNKFMRHEVVQ